jgi:hypothetical protein
MKSSLETQRELRRERLDKARKAASPLGRVYPQVQKIRLELAFADNIARPPAAQSLLFYPPARAFFQFPCPHADCNGQLDLDEIVTRAIDSATRDIQGELVCAGIRPERGATSRTCELRVLYHVTAFYS